MIADGDRMRRAVPSPVPQRIFEIDVIRALVDHGVIVICTGGGAIPVRNSDEPAPAGRRLTGVEAVIALIRGETGSRVALDPGAVPAG
jgi:carbamate kinase